MSTPKQTYTKAETIEGYSVSITYETPGDVVIRVVVPFLSCAFEYPDAIDAAREAIRTYIEQQRCASTFGNPAKIIPVEMPPLPEPNEQQQSRPRMRR